MLRTGTVLDQFLQCNRVHDSLHAFAYLFRLPEVAKAVQCIALHSAVM